MRNFLGFMLVFFLTGNLFAQDDLLSELDTVKSSEKQIEIAAFKGLQIANMQSTKLPAKGEWYMIVSHRFGDLSEGFNNFFGLDNALTKFGGIYGVTNWLSFGATRHTYNKIYEIAVKYKMANQEVNGFPVTIVGYNTIDINSGLEKEIYPNIRFSDRLAFTTQLLVSRKVNEKFSAEIGLINVYKNLYDDSVEQQNVFSAAAGLRYKIAKRMSVNLEYAARVITDEKAIDPYHNPLTVGLDIETGGHVFQLVFSNSQPMNDVAVFSTAAGDWNKGKVYFGFNMYRSF
ncbi:DUF5777 family beta-barrel protein [Flavobacterium limi]|uniref:DUF5777 domain-containing protein n=1 Tax=Flavobacterium limi TaxID=2045105 RepID=A0ABQ1URT6_9FLAO|nr:DUF5777 family beta-barrel protein [Flavobacterium limi]GGF25113.1 hypothetical protein GCM10011518_38090 [Flavobacterium limi]